MPSKGKHKVSFAPLPDEEARSEQLSAEILPIKLWKRCIWLHEPALASVCWSVCSVGMTILNKWAVDLTSSPMGVIVVQLAVSSLCALASGQVHFGNGTLKWAVSVPWLFVVMMVSSMMAMQHVTLGTIVVVRNLGPVITLLVETLVHRPDNLSCDAKTVASTLSIGVGVLLYELNEVRFSAVGTLWLLSNLVSACAERMVQRHLLAVHAVDVSKPGLMLLNNGIGCVLSALALQLTAPAQWHKLYRAARRERHALVAVAASSIVAPALSYTGLWLQRNVTATSFMVLGSATKLAVIAWGILFLRDAHGALSVSGALLSIVGAYAYARGTSPLGVCRRAARRARTVFCDIFC